MTSSANYNDTSELLDIEPLQISEHGHIDDFDFFHEVRVDGEPLFTSGSKNGIDGLFTFETVETDESCDNVVHCNSLRSKRGRCSGSGPNPPHKLERCQMNVVNFDHPLQHQSTAKNHRQAIYNNLSTSFIQSSSALLAANQQVTKSTNIRQFSKAGYEEALQKLVESMRRSDVTRRLVKVEYKEALQNLVESMKRSEVTRHHVMVQRGMLAPEQQRALRQAKERLRDQQNQRQRVQQQQRQQEMSSAVVNHPVVRSFVNGSIAGGSFADKMVQSRKNRFAFVLG